MNPSHIKIGLRLLLVEKLILGTVDILRKISYWNEMKKIECVEFTTMMLNAQMTTIYI